MIGIANSQPYVAYVACTEALDILITLDCNVLHYLTTANNVLVRIPPAAVFLLLLQQRGLHEVSGVLDILDHSY
jgi:hypothetical protein